MVKPTNSVVAAGGRGQGAADLCPVSPGTRGGLHVFKYTVRDQSGAQSGLAMVPVNVK